MLIELKVHNNIISVALEHLISISINSHLFEKFNLYILNVNKIVCIFNILF